MTSVSIGRNVHAYHLALDNYFIFDPNSPFEKSCPCHFKRTHEYSLYVHWKTCLQCRARGHQVMNRLPDVLQPAAAAAPGCLQRKQKQSQWYRWRHFLCWSRAAMHLMDDVRPAATSTRFIIHVFPLYRPSDGPSVCDLPERSTRGRHQIAR